MKSSGKFNIWTLNVKIVGQKIENNLEYIQKVISTLYEVLLKKMIPTIGNTRHPISFGIQFKLFKAKNCIRWRLSFILYRQFSRLKNDIASKLLTKQTVVRVSV